jgi:archaemetzincin
VIAMLCVIALVPFGDATVPDVAPVVRERFGCEVVTAPRLRLPSARGGQVPASAILEALAAARRPEWTKLLGVADVDLSAPGLSFVFGQADGERGVAVFSLARLHHADPVVFARRAATEAVHELGHAFDLGHCDDPRCVMWFSNTLDESDRKGTGFCARHAAQLRRVLAR